MSETSSSEQDRSQEVLRAMFKRDRLMIIELRKYNGNWRTTYGEENHRVCRHK